MRTRLTLLKRHPESSNVESFQFQATPEANYAAGQYLRWYLPHDNPDDRGITRYFTISSAPGERFIMITTKFSKNHSSSFKAALKKMQIGQEIRAEGPGGNFTYPNPEQPAVFIAGGIGITPFRSILVDLDLKNINPPIILIYSNKTTDIPFKKELDLIAKRRNSLKIVYTVTEADKTWPGESRPIDADFIKNNAPSLPSANILYYVSGPKPMVEAIQQELVGMGITKEHIKQDFFPGYQD